MNSMPHVLEVYNSLTDKVTRYNIVSLKVLQSDMELTSDLKGNTLIIPFGTVLKVGTKIEEV